ncbi:hypothetical protein Pflav_039530 [Phytohabitans flavus]|uniref:HTH arsR-type domain-containing protein n=2 Tax=Phytohabitans flavus TaxID=1076124 RepID=A0A6F8XUN8_9ACTN|nr:hypothetical protein Pflav_039530 [Phytohabitans flavus]
MEGYGWLSNRRRRTTDGVVKTRLLGQPVTALCGPDAARFFYAEGNVHRHGAIPGPVQDTLLGRGGVQSLDGVDHRLRKAMFMSMLSGDGVGLLERLATEAWDAAVASWATRDRVVLFDEVARLLTRAVGPWAGLRPEEVDVDPFAADLVSMVDGFAAAGRRQWQARRARARREAWLTDVIVRARTTAPAPAGSALAAIAEHTDAVGDPLDARVAAVELLNVLRPTVAVCWFVTFAAHALHRWPEHRDRLRDDDPEYAEAFGHEVRRFYPFAPFVAARASRDLEWDKHRIPAGSLVLLDIYGQNHHPRLWPDPYGFAPGRFLERRVGPYELIPQGGGDPRTGHRCPGETLTVALLRALLPMLARLDYEMPDQDVSISLRRVPARPRSGMVLANIRTPPSGPPEGARTPAVESALTRIPVRTTLLSMEAVASVADLETLQVLAHPIRLRILAALRSPASAAVVARGIDQPRQKVNYHVKELERAGLVRRVGERRAGNLMESLYQAVAATFVVSPRVAWTDPRRVGALADQVALESLVATGERLQRAAAQLLDRAAFDGEQIASAAVEGRCGWPARRSARPS